MCVRFKSTRHAVLNTFPRLMQLVPECVCVCVCLYVSIFFGGGGVKRSSLCNDGCR